MPAEWLHDEASEGPRLAEHKTKNSKTGELWKRSFCYVRSYSGIVFRMDASEVAVSACDQADIPNRLYRATAQ